MVFNDLKEENYQEYLRLQGDNDYVEVVFDEQSGGVSAVHKSHRFDKQIGIDGRKRGSYELRVVEVIRSKGHSIILLNESPNVGKKQYDGLLNGKPCEIKAVEQIARWTIRTKISNAIRQGAETVVLYFPDKSLFSGLRVQDGWKDVISYTKSTEYVPEIKVLCVVDGRVYTIEKPSW